MFLMNIFEKKICDLDSNYTYLGRQKNDNDINVPIAPVSSGVAGHDTTRPL
jgi:hypothetical protein